MAPTISAPRFKNPMCRWLDSSLMIAPGFHAPANAAAHAITFCAEPNLGPRFPLLPTLDREGTAYNPGNVKLRVPPRQSRGFSNFNKR